MSQVHRLDPELSRIDTAKAPVPYARRINRGQRCGSALARDVGYRNPIARERAPTTTRRGFSACGGTGWQAIPLHRLRQFLVGQGEVAGICGGVYGDDVAIVPGEFAVACIRDGLRPPIVG